MARPLRIEYDGALYHVTSRGNRRIAEAATAHGYSQMEVAKHMKLHYLTVSRLIKSVTEQQR
jgi:transposase